MKTLILILLFCTCALNVINAQGTFVFDQESSNDEVSPFSTVAFQFYGTVGQSFTPSLSAVGFVRLRLGDLNPGNSLGATLVLNLRLSAISGPIIGTATPIAFDDGFAGGVNFVFPSAIPVSSGSTYFLEASVQSGDTWGAIALGDSYPGGIFYGGPAPGSGNDLWFREGIIVPEPSACVLLIGGCVGLWLILKRR